MIASLYVFFLLLLYVSHIRVYRVCLSTAITDNPNSVSYQEIAYFYTFFCFFFRLKFSKTPFHVVLSKNKTNTKKKISFLIINFCFFPQFTDFNSVHKCEPFTPKANGSRVCFFLFFGVAFTFSFFFSRFFLYFVTKIYFSALTVLLLTPSFPLFAYYFHSVSIVLLS